MFAILLLVASTCAHAQMSQADAFALGKGAGGQSNLSAIVDMITTLRGKEVIKGFSETSPPQADTWQGKSTLVNTLIQGGNDRIAECTSSSSSSTDPSQNQQCEAIKAILQQNATKPSDLVTKTDALYLKGRSIAANPEAIAGSLEQSYTDCVVKEVSSQAPTVEQTCEEYGQTSNETCSTGTEITLDPDHFYKCLETINIPASSTCTYGRKVLIDKDTNYQCLSTVQALKTGTCKKTAIIKVENSGEPAWECANPNTPIFTTIWKSTGTWYGYTARLHCTTTPDTFKVNYFFDYTVKDANTRLSKNNYSKPALSITVASNNTLVNGFIPSPYKPNSSKNLTCQYDRASAKIACDKANCSLEAMYDHVWLSFGNNNMTTCKSEDHDATTTTKAFTAPIGTFKQVPSVTWQNDCTTYEASAL